MVAIVGVNEGDPAIDRAFVIGCDPEDFIKDIGGRPQACLQIESVAAKTRDTLRLLQ